MAVMKLVDDVKGGPHHWKNPVHRQACSCTLGVTACFLRYMHLDPSCKCRRVTRRVCGSWWSWISAVRKDRYDYKRYRRWWEQFLSQFVNIVISVVLLVDCRSVGCCTAVCMKLLGPRFSISLSSWSHLRSILFPCLDQSAIWLVTWKVYLLRWWILVDSRHPI